MANFDWGPELYEIRFHSWQFASTVDSNNALNVPPATTPPLPNFAPPSVRQSVNPGKFTI